MWVEGGVDRNRTCPRWAFLLHTGSYGVVVSTNSSTWGTGPHTVLPVEDELHPWTPPAPNPGLLPHLLMPTAPQSWVLPSATGQQPHLVDHHSSLEDGQEVRWLLAHRDPDLDRFVVVLLVQDDGLISRRCYFILAGLATLGTSTMEAGETQSALVLSPSLAAANSIPDSHLALNPTVCPTKERPEHSPPNMTQTRLIPAPHLILSQPPRQP